MTLSRYRNRILVSAAVLLGGLVGGMGCARAQSAERWDSGGPLLPEQAAYDVTFYELTLDVDPADSTIEGSVVTRARIVQPLEWFVLDLDTLLAVRGVEAVSDGGDRTPLAFERRGGRLWIAFPTMQQPGDEVAVAVAYGGRPRVAPRPPWSGGFTWARTPSGAPWIATTCQQEGADVWWPVKDHVSDEPDSVALHITVPEPLVVATNGVLGAVDPASDGRRTYHWFVSTPVNSYNVALNIAPYRVVEDTMRSVAGDVFPIQFYVLPENEADGRALMPEIKEHLRFYEDLLGPYPFRADKYGVAQTPHLGMEHQTIIAYGAGFNNGAMTGGRDWGFDALHHHELSHEWWGNMVTNADWRDMWLHEGFGTYMQALYMERLGGPEGYRAYMADMKNGIRNRYPIAPPASQTAKEIYRADIYPKGGYVLHTLRYLLGDEAFFPALRRMAYPDPAMEAVTDGRQCRFVTTRDVMTTAERAYGQPLDWFFDAYTRRAALPRLETNREGSRLTLQWNVPDGPPFPMPVDVQIGDRVQRVEMPDGRATIEVPEGEAVTIDPDHWVLREDDLD